jgi:uncharacterized surface protein with fasciclin (FAS1) repeats
MPPLTSTRRSFLATAVLVSGLAGCATVASPLSVAETIARTPSLSTLNSLLARTGLVESLKANGPYTVFAPSNEAFQALPAKTMEELTAQPEKLKALLTYHLLPTRLMAADIKNSNAKTVQGANLALATAGAFVIVENATVTHADLVSTNGVVHVIDTVLLPPAK